MKLALTALLLSSALALWGQLYSSGGPVVNNVGQPVAAQIAVCTTQPPLPNPPTTNPPNCSVYAATYTDATLGTPCILAPTTLGPISGTGCTNPGKTDSRGNYTVFAFSNVYYLEFYGYGITTYIMPASTATTAGNFSSPPPIGNVTPNTGAFTTVNGIINPLDYSGSDLAAKVATAATANSCSSTVPCNIVLPPLTTQLSFSGILTLTDAMTFSCTPAGQATRQGGTGTQPFNLNYTGSGIAVQITGARAQFNNCGLVMGNATTGIVIGSAPGTNNAQVNNVFTQGGNVGSVLLEMGKSDNTQINQFTAFEFSGDGIWAHDLYDATITNALMYGYDVGGTNHTGRSLVLDSGIGGMHITNFTGGSSGLHGLVLQDLKNPGHAPTQIFVNDFTSDCSYGDGVYMDPSLGTQAVEAQFNLMWSAGSGDSCNGTSIRGLTSANNVHISGGHGYYFSGGFFRSAANNNFLIDSANVQDVNISDSMLYGGNCFSNHTASTVAGVNVTANIDGLKVTGNTDGFPEYCGNQGWGVLIGSGLTSMNNVRIANNDFYGNTSGGISAPSGIVITQSGNTNSSIAGTPNIFGNGDFGVFSSLNRNNAWTYAPGSNGLGGIGVNGFQNGTNLIFRTDGSHNGGTLLNMNYGPAPVYQFYIVPDSGTPTADQTIAVSGLSSYLKAAIDTNGFNGAIGGTTPAAGKFTSVTIGGTNTAPVVATPTVGQAACIYAAGPPVQIGKCTSVVGAGGACTCAP